MTDIKISFPDPKPEDLVSTFDVTTWVVLRATFKVLKEKGLITEDDYPKMAAIAEEEATRFDEAGEVQRAAAARHAAQLFDLSDTTAGGGE